MPPPSRSGKPPSRRPAPEGKARPSRPPPPTRTAEVATASLVGEAGAAEGKTFPLEGDELVIGRSAENAIALQDTSLSRKHALVRKTEDGWSVSDLGSGNGTTLNGESIVDETPLSDGDVIAVGDCTLRFQSAAEPAAAELAPRSRPPVRTSRTQGGGTGLERPSPRGRPVRTSRMADDPAATQARKRVIFIRVAGVIGLVMALGIGWAAIAKKQADKTLFASAAAKDHKDEMAALFNEAKQLIRAGKWIEARAKLAEIKEIDPDYEPTSVENYIKVSEVELPAAALLEQAKAAIAKGQLGEALKLLGQVKTTTQQVQLRNAQDALEARVASRLAEARVLAGFTNDLGKLEQLRTACDDVLAVHPDDREATEYKRQAEAAIYRIKNPTVAPPAPETPWLDVQQRYKNGDTAGALSLAEGCAPKFPQCRSLAGNIEEFESKSKKLDDLGENELIALFELDRKIAGGTSSDQSQPLRTQMKSKLFVKASQAKTTGNWAKAVEYARRVLQADPNHVGAQSLVTEARNQARDIYHRGYQLKDTMPDEALLLFKEVLTVVPSDDENYVKAKARIQELQH